MIQALFDSKLLLFFLIVIGVAVIILLGIFITQIFKANDGIFQAIKLIATTDHEDKAREQQTLTEQKDRSNQSRVLIHQIKTISSENNAEIKNLITKYNNTTEKTFALMKQAMDQNRFQQQQNANMTRILLDIYQAILNDTNSTNTQVSKYGPENNALGKAILDLLGGNSTQVIQDEVYANQTLKKMIVKPQLP